MATKIERMYRDVQALPQPAEPILQYINHLQQLLSDMADQIGPDVQDFPWEK